MFCGKCGKEVQEGTAFCPSCGAKVGANVGNVNATPQPAVQQSQTQQPAVAPAHQSQKRSTILLVSWCLGFAYMVTMLVTLIVTISHPTPSGNEFSFKLLGEALREDKPLQLALLLMLLYNIALIVAPILNLIGWRKNSKAMVLTAAILSLPTVNVVSAILCFIGFVKLRKLTPKTQG